MNIPILVLAAVFLLIAFRGVRHFRLPIWQAMLLGALMVLVTGQISPAQALRAINPDVMLFLFGAFVVGQALEEGGYLLHLSYRTFNRLGHRFISIAVGAWFGAPNRSRPSLLSACC
ncbi:MAG: hypothetical protein AAB134_07910 [Pseudomonadota bacterium]